MINVVQTKTSINSEPKVQAFSCYTWCYFILDFSMSYRPYSICSYRHSWAGKITTNCHVGAFVWSLAFAQSSLLILPICCILPKVTSEKFTSTLSKNVFHLLRGNLCKSALRFLYWFTPPYYTVQRQTKKSTVTYLGPAPANKVLVTDDLLVNLLCFII